MGVEGNEKAHKMANETAEKAGTARYPECFPSLTHIGRKISERKWKVANDWFKMENNNCPPLQRARYDQALESENTDVAGMKEAVYVSKQYVQLKTRHAVTGTYLHLIGKVETDHCWECTTRAQMDTRNILFE